MEPAELSGTPVSITTVQGLRSHKNGVVSNTAEINSDVTNGILVFCCYCGNFMPFATKAVLTADCTISIVPDSNT
jgi:hypothetical protein